MFDYVALAKYYIGRFMNIQRCELSLATGITIDIPAWRTSYAHSNGIARKTIGLFYSLYYVYIYLRDS